MHQPRQQCSYLLSLLLKHQWKRRPVQKIHSQLVVTGLLLSHISTPLLNAVLRHYSLGPFPQEALFFFKYLRSSSSSSSCPLFNGFTYCSLFRACTNLHNLQTGIELHALTFKVGLEFHLYVQTYLVRLYVFGGSLFDARRVFDEMPERSSVTWNVLITGLVNWGDLSLAQSLFDRMPDRTVVSWTGLIDGYAHINRPKQALSLFRRMVLLEDVKPNEITTLAILPAISNLGALHMCRSIHAYALKCDFIIPKASEIHVANSLIDTYAKCGSMRSASSVFEQISPKMRTLVSWTAIISGFALHGMAEEAVMSFQRMERACVKPNRVTFLSILNGCSHGGLIEEGLNFFNKMFKECRVLPDIKHYGCLIDMLARAGRLDEAERIATEIPGEIANAVVWRTILGACSFHGYVEMGERVTRKIMDMERTHNVDHVLLSNIFTGAGRFSEAEKVRRLIDESHSPKYKGLSLV